MILTEKYKSLSAVENIFEMLFLFFLCISWSLYPVLIKFLMPIMFQGIVLVFFFTLLFFALKYRIKNKLFYGRLEKNILLFTSVYFMVLFFSTITNYTLNSMYQYFIYLSKYVVLVFILLYINKRIIYKSFQYYAYLSLVIVLIGIFVGIGVAFDVFTHSEWLTSVVNHDFKVYYGSYYSYSGVEWFGTTIYRLQGLSEEAGTFALSLIPALLWFLLIEKSVLKYSIIMIGLIWSFSVAAFLLFPIFIYLLYRINFDKSLIKWLLIGVSVFFIVFFRNYILQFMFGMFGMSGMSGMSGTFATDRIVSAQDRIGDILFYFNYLSNEFFIDKLIGIGAGNAFQPIYGHSISVGYLVKLVEAGIVGGVSNMLAFGFLLFLSIYMAINSKKYDNQNLIILISFSTISCILISFLRQPSDVSYWQMWIYASLVYFRMLKDETTQIGSV